MDTSGQLAQVYEQEFPEANAAIDKAIAANTWIPDELFLVPRNQVIKAENRPLAQQLCRELLQLVSETAHKRDLIVVPDGSLRLLPFSALKDGNGCFRASHTVDVNPSATVYELLHKQASAPEKVSLPYVGVAAWT